jgi:hypothetical protein
LQNDYNGGEACVWFTTWSDAAFLYWTDPDLVVSNLELEDGNDLLLESEGFILMEIGNG